ncbi:hypothetical protein [Paeniglutamicibacter cryotolerans]|uniref:Uncharacterized protein n=1 Tax=Paeniglutamicibacter cryotolerans TaxID=670079 RepID=A0A839QU06_9MICC|nr:hypothetical protein [Paeniglutamicibacter cryotolerans]MBB2995511.1 hypothetical protein [Paeniglutamicibacter cryotolerans]
MDTIRSKGPAFLVPEYYWLMTVIVSVEAYCPGEVPVGMSRLSPALTVALPSAFMCAKVRDSDGFHRGARSEGDAGGNDGMRTPAQGTAGKAAGA